MAGGLVVGDIVEVSFIGTAFEQLILNILHYRVTVQAPGTTTVQGDLANIALSFAVGGDNDLASLMVPLLSTNYGMDFVKAQAVFPVRYASVQVASVIQGTGGTGARTNDAGVITKRTQLSGRDQVGSIHLGPLPDDLVNSGQVTNDWLTAANTLGDAMLLVVSPTGGPTMEPVLWHRTVPASGQYSTRITNTIAQDTVRTMRRRTVRLGQ